MVDLKNYLKKVLQDIDSRDKTFIAYENQLIKLTNELFSLQHRIYQFHQSVTMSSSTASSSENIYTLIATVQANFKYLADCYRGVNGDVLLSTEINDL